MIYENVSDNFVVENSFTSIKVTIRGRKKWGAFLPAFFVFLVQGFCFLPVVGLLLFGFVQKNFSEAIQGIISLSAFTLYLYILYKKSLEAFEHIFDIETIEIDNDSISVEKSGFLGLKTKKVFLAENINGLFTSLHVSEQFNFLNRVPFVSPKLSTFMIWHNRGLKQLYTFGDNVSQLEAEMFLETVYKKYPKYRYTGTT